MASGMDLENPGVDIPDHSSSLQGTGAGAATSCTCAGGISAMQPAWSGGHRSLGTLATSPWGHWSLIPGDIGQLWPVPCLCSGLGCAPGGEAVRKNAGKHPIPYWIYPTGKSTVFSHRDSLPGVQAGGFQGGKPMELQGSSHG